MPNYEKIKSELIQDLEKLTPIINILDELRITGKAASVEESKKIIEDFNKYLSGLPNSKIFHYDLIIRPQDVHSTALQVHSWNQY